MKIKQIEKALEFLQSDGVSLVVIQAAFPSQLDAVKKYISGLYYTNKYSENHWKFGFTEEKKIIRFELTSGLEPGTGTYAPIFLIEPKGVEWNTLEEVYELPIEDILKEEL